MSAPKPDSGNEREIVIEVRNLEISYGSFVLMRDLNFQIRRGDIFIIMG